MPRRVASYDNATRSWYGQIPFDRPEWAAEMLTTLFDVARLHGTDIRVQTPPRARTAYPGRSYAADTPCQPYPESGGGTVARRLTAGQP
jgi:hypothetical protein